MRKLRWFAMFGAVVFSASFAACGDDDSGDDSSGAPASVLTATAIASGSSETPSGDATSDAGEAGEDYTGGDDPEAFLDYVLLQPEDITETDWVVQSDAVTDNDAAAAADPENAELIERCGRLAGRTITNFPPDSVAAFFNGTTLAYFSQGTLYETPEGAADCAAASVARLSEPGALARTFGEVFTSPDGVVVTPVEYEQVGDGTFAATLRGVTDVNGTEIDLTILVVSFRDQAATYAVGMAVSGIDPPVAELQPYVDLVFERSQEAQQ